MLRVTGRVLIALLYSIINLSKTTGCCNSPFGRRGFYSASSEINQHPAWSVERHYFTPDSNASDQSSEKALTSWQLTDIEQRYENLVFCTVSLVNSGFANKARFLSVETISYCHVHNQAKVSTLLLIAAFPYLITIFQLFHQKTSDKLYEIELTSCLPLGARTEKRKTGPRFQNILHLNISFNEFKMKPATRQQPKTNRRKLFEKKSKNLKKKTWVNEILREKKHIEEKKVLWGDEKRWSQWGNAWKLY